MPPDGETLRGLTWDHPRGYAPLEAASIEYAAETGVRVVWNRRSLKDFGDQQLNDLADRYDLLVIDHPHVGLAAEQGFLAPLDDLIDTQTLQSLAAESPGQMHQSYNYVGRQWALAIDLACQVAAARSDLLCRPAISFVVNQLLWPATWNDVARLAEQFRIHRLWMGMALCPTDCACSLLTLLAQHRMPMRENVPLLNTAAVVAALEWIRRLAQLAHPESTQWNPIQLYEAMVDSDEIVFSPLAFGYINYVQPSFRRASLVFGPIPGRTNSLLGGAGIAVSSRTTRSALAARFASYVAGEECQSGVYLRAGGQPAHAKVWKNPADNELGGFLRGTGDTVHHAHVRPRAAWWVEFQPQLGDLVHDFLTYRSDSAAVAREINERYQKCRAAK